MMELELHQLELRYANVRKRHPAQERALLSSLAEIGQQLPIVVIEETSAQAVAPLQAAASLPASRYVEIDGYKRVRALKRLASNAALGNEGHPDREEDASLPGETLSSHFQRFDGARGRGRASRETYCSACS